MYIAVVMTALPLCPLCRAFGIVFSFRLHRLSRHLFAARWKDQLCTVLQPGNHFNGTLFTKHYSIHKSGSFCLYGERIC